MPIPLIPAIVSSVIQGAVGNATVPAAPAQGLVEPGPMAGEMRRIPAEAHRGILTSAEFGAVQIGGEAFTLSPSAHIFDESNLNVVPTMVQGPVPVRYLVDGMGNVSRIWILTSAELAASR